MGGTALDRGLRASLIAVALSRPAMSQAPPSMVKDVRTSAWSAVDSALTAALQVGPTVFFVSSEFGFYPSRLYRAAPDGSGATVVYDFSPGSGVRAGTVLDVGGRLLFGVVGIDSGIWTSDGTTAGTRPLAIFTWGSGVKRAAVAGGRGFFLVDEPGGGCELWVSDGTAGGTSLLHAFSPPLLDNRRYGLAALGGAMIVSPANGTLWRTDGTPAGTSDLGVAGVDGPLASGAGFVAFVAGGEPWRTDGTPGGTTLLLDINAASRSIDPNDTMVANGGLVWFSAWDGVERRVWKTDGTTAGTTIGAAPGAGDPIAGAGAYVYGFHGVSPMRLYRTDGTVGGTVFDLATYDGCFRDWGGKGWASFGSRFVFGSGGEPWMTDGTPEGTHQIADVRPGPSGSCVGDFFVGGSGVFFTADDGVHGLEPWFTDTASNTRLVADLSSPDASSNPARFQAIGNEILFQAIGEDGVVATFRTDGTEVGTSPLKSSIPGAYGSPAGAPVLVGNRAIFAAWDQSTGSNVWGQEAPGDAATLLTSFTPGDYGATGPVVSLGPRAVFAAGDLASGYEPWTTDGTVSGTKLLRDLNNGPADSLPRAMFAFDGIALFFADDGSGSALWRTDGTGAGTSKIAPDVLGGEFVRVGPVVWFSTWGPRPGLWRTDGTDTGTTLVNAADDVNGLVAFTAGDGVERLFFLEDDGQHGIEPWVSDGTSGGTFMLGDLMPGPDSSATPGVAVGGRVVFGARTPAHGREPWVTDGTVAGTHLLRDILPGIGGSLSIGQAEMAGAGRVALFGAHDGLHGFELWRTDGTPGGTELVSDIRPGPIGSLDPLQKSIFGRPDKLRAGNRVYFAANDGIHGSEVWSLGVGTRFFPLEPCRAFDTRGGAASVSGARDQAFVLASTCGVPANALQVVANLTTVMPTDDGALRAFPGGPFVPDAWTVGLRAGRTRAVGTILGLGTDGAFHLFGEFAPGGTVDVVVDVTGYFE